MKKVICLCVAFVMVLCCFAGCQKPLTEEEKALKELQDAWNAMVVEKTEEIKCVTQFGGLASSAAENVDPEDIAALLDYLKKLELDPKKFVLGVEEGKIIPFMGWSVFLWNNTDYDYDREAYEEGALVRPLIVTVTGDNMLYIKLAGKEDVYARYLEEVSADTYHKTLDGMKNFRLGGNESIALF